MKDDDDFTELFNALPKDLRDELARAVEESGATSPEDFASQIFVGECPQCLSSNTKDCEGVAEIEDITIGLCKDCGHVWCTECGRTVTKGSACEKGLRMRGQKAHHRFSLRYCLIFLFMMFLPPLFDCNT